MSGDRDPMLEFSTALADLVDLIERRGSEQLHEAARAAALEVGTPLAEMLDAVQRMGPELARSLAAALQQVRAEAPVVNVTVPVPEVVVELPQAAGWDFDVQYHPTGAIKGLKARRAA